MPRPAPAPAARPSPAPPERFAATPRSAATPPAFGALHCPPPAHGLSWRKAPRRGPPRSPWPAAASQLRAPRQLLEPPRWPRARPSSKTTPVRSRRHVASSHLPPAHTSWPPLASAASASRPPHRCPTCAPRSPGAPPSSRRLCGASRQPARTSHAAPPYAWRPLPFAAASPPPPPHPDPAASPRCFATPAESVWTSPGAWPLSQPWPPAPRGPRTLSGAAPAPSCLAPPQGSPSTPASGFFPLASGG
mmetsp:Transcript_27370/g.78875  ORF Transcript_27370/g.78875 Transcript_27370/m.78875 type:complete len:248 (-) Transcript_27370:361-1104(-)